MNAGEGAAGSAAWRTAGGGNARRATLAQPVAWRRPARRCHEAHGGIQAAVVFDATQRAFVADKTGVIQTFAPSGKRLWKQSLPGGISATPAVDAGDSLVFAGDHTGFVAAFETGTGKPRWTRTLNSPRDPRILSDLLHLPRSNRLILSSWSGRFHALDAATGETRLEWDAGIAPRVAASADRDETVYCLRAVAGKGTELVRVRGEGEPSVLFLEREDSRGANRALVAAAPVLDEDRGVLYLVVNRERTGHLLAWALPTDSLLWERKLGAPVQATPAVAPDGTVFAADLAGHVHAFTPDGNRRFDCDLHCDFLLAAGIAAAGGRFVVGDPVGVIHAIDAHGASQAMHEGPRSLEAQPSIDPAGNLYVPCTDRWVYRFEAVRASG